VLFVTIVVSMKINRRHYFQSDPCSSESTETKVNVAILTQDDVSVFCHNGARNRRVMVWAVLLAQLFFLNNAGMSPQIEVLYYWRNLDWHFAFTVLSFLNHKRHEIY